MFAVKFVMNGKCCLAKIAGSFVRLFNRIINIGKTNRFMIFRIYGIVRAGDETIYSAKCLGSQYHLETNLSANEHVIFLTLIKYF